MNKLQKILDKSKLFLSCAFIIISPIAGPCVLAALWLLSRMIPAHVKKADRIMILTFFSLIGGAVALFCGLTSLPLSLLGVVVALLVLCFYKTPTTTRVTANSRHRDVSDDFWKEPGYEYYHNKTANCDDGIIEAEIIDDPTDRIKWKSGFNFK